MYFPLSQLFSFVTFNSKSCYFIIMMESFCIDNQSQLADLVGTSSSILLVVGVDFFVVSVSVLYAY